MGRRRCPGKWRLREVIDLFLDLLQPDLARELAARPERLHDLIQAVPPVHSPVVIDEVQRVPELLNLVHALTRTRADCDIARPASRRIS